MALPVPRATMVYSGHRRKYLPRYVPGDYIKAVRKALQLKDYWKTYQWRIKTKRNNHSFVCGPVGEGKTNALLYFVQKANELYNHKMVIKRYLNRQRRRQYTSIYLGRAVSLHPNLMGKMHGLLAGKANEAIGVDETELCVPSGSATKQVTAALEFCDTIRENMINGFYAAPTSRTVNSRFVDERMQWRINADYVDQEKRYVECTIELNAVEKADRGAEWIHYQDLNIEFVDTAIFKRFQQIKRKEVYTLEGLAFTYDDLMKQEKRDAKIDSKTDYLQQYQKILKSSGSKRTKIEEALQLTKAFVGNDGIAKSLIKNDFNVGWDQIAEYERELLLRLAAQKER